MPRWAVVVLSVVAGVAAIVALGFVFRGGDEEAVVVTTTEATTTTTAELEPATLQITIRDGEPVGGIQQLTVERGETVSVRVVSDVDDEVHVHGYDVTGQVTPGGTTELEFEATIAGRFEIELEDRGIPVAELEVRP